MSGELAKREGGNVFDIRVGVAIVVLVKKPDSTGHGEIRYYEAPDHTSKQAKLDEVAHMGSALRLQTQTIEPNPSGDWLSQRDAEFESFRPLGLKGAPGEGIFETYSRGLATARDAWVYSSRKSDVERNVDRMVSFYNEQVGAIAASGRSSEKVDDVIDFDPKRMSWNRADKTRA